LGGFQFVFWGGFVCLFLSPTRKYSADRRAWLGQFLLQQDTYPVTVRHFCAARHHLPASGWWRQIFLLSFSQVVKACNEGVRKMSRTEQMISIQKKLEFKIKV